LAEELAYWLALHRVPGIGPRVFGGLLESYGTPEAAFAAGPTEWRRHRLAPPVLNAMRQPDWDAVARDLEWADGRERHIVVLTDPRYPERLREIPDPPPVLFVCGRPEVLGRAQLAMVGSRHPTVDGRRSARAFASELGARGLIITSGLAEGIDGASHEGALAAGAASVAVAGTGPDRIYPARNRALAEGIVATGAMVSEFPVGTPVQAQNFPRRNRIISGLSLGVLVVEATTRSGSLITARLALEQGREVFAIPGSIHSPLARGCNALIRQGAKLVETAEDVLEELGSIAMVAPPSTPAPEADAPVSTPALETDYVDLLGVIGHQPVSVDTISHRSGLTAEVVSSMLLMLELEGYVAAVAGGRYRRTAKG